MESENQECPDFEKVQISNGQDYSGDPKSRRPDFERLIVDQVPNGLVFECHSKSRRKNVRFSKAIRNLEEEVQVSNSQPFQS